MANLDVTAANLQPSLPGVTNAQAQPDREQMRTGGIVRVIGRLLILSCPSVSRCCSFTRSSGCSRQV